MTKLRVVYILKMKAEYQWADQGRHGSEEGALQKAEEMPNELHVTIAAIT